MSGVSGNPILKYTQGILSPEERAADVETVEKIRTFMEGTPAVIDPIIA